MKTTLNKIRVHTPCPSGWKKLLKNLGKTMPDDEPLLITTILDSNGLDDAFWCLRAVDGFQKEMRLYAVDSARSVQHLLTDPRSIAAIDVAERHAHGLATDAELSSARDAAGDARDAEWDARDAAGDIAWDVAWATARAAAWDAARDVARTAARRAARDAILALVAWDHAGALLDLPAEQVRVLALLGQPPAILIYPTVLAMENSPKSLIINKIDLVDQ